MRDLVVEESLEEAGWERWENRRRGKVGKRKEEIVGGGGGGGVGVGGGNGSGGGKEKKKRR